LGCAEISTQLRDEISRIYAACEGRDMTPDERGHIEANLELIEQQARIEGKARALGAAPSSGFADRNANLGGGGPGDVFVQSQG
jgi:hypothetical protein